MIRAEHIVKSFDGRVVLKDISATFATGKTNLIIGQSGSGKTVLLKSLVGLHAIDSGQIYYDDVCYTSLSFTERKAIRQQIGMIFQGGALLDSSTVEENVRLPLDLFTNQSSKEKRDRVNFCLQRVNLKDVNDLYPAELSGGMIKRVAIARAIVMNPKYLFCDEPNSGLDPMTSVVIDNLIGDHRGVQHHHDHQHARHELGARDRRTRDLHLQRGEVVGRQQARHPEFRQPGAQRIRFRLDNGQTCQSLQRTAHLRNRPISRRHNGTGHSDKTQTGLPHE